MLVALAQVAHGQGQKTRVRGNVIDAATREPVAYATIALKGTHTGTISSDEGHFFISTSTPGDTLVVAFVGYETVELAIKPGHFQEVTVELHEATRSLGEVVVYRDEGPVLRLLDSVIAHKDEHNPDLRTSYSSRVYNKLQIDVNNVDTGLFDKGPMKQLRFLKQHLDTNAATGKNFIPVFVSESLSKLYYQSSPQSRREEILNTQMSGIENEEYAQFAGTFYQDFNIYNNYISVFNQGLVSPIHSRGRMYYEYFLVDSADVDGQKRYRVSFRPRRRYEPTFRGYMWIADGSYAVIEAQYELARDANLNFVNYVMGDEEYQLVDGRTWFPRRKHFFVDLNLTDQTFGLFGHKTTLYDSVKLGATIPPRLLRGNEEVVVAEGAHEAGEKYWDSIRPVPLSGSETSVFAMVDSVKQLPLYRGARRVWLMLLERYFPLRYVDIGPWQRIYTYNEVEGHRFTFGLRTNADITRHVQVWGYAGYGTRDAQWKWKGGALWVIKRRPWHTLRLEAGHEVEVLGQGKKSIEEDNLLSALLRERRNNKLTMVDRGEISYFHEWITGLSTEFTASHSRVYPTAYVPFVRTDGSRAPSLNDTRLEVEFRWKYRERFITNSFYRQSAGSKYPEISVNVAGALRGVLRSDFSYLRLSARVRQKVMLNPIGYSWILMEGGYLFGRVPYPLLRLHEGNGTYALSRFHFNMLDHYEFASDRWAELLWEHHFMGLLFNHIPWVRRLNLREVVTAKVMVGDAKRANLHLFTPPEGLGPIGRVPYVELSAGLENILHILRVDAVWRVTHPQVNRRHQFTVRVGVAIQF